jgi:conjugal transfer pilus assembly protein TrbC
VASHRKLIDVCLISLCVLYSAAQAQQRPQFPSDQTLSEELQRIEQQRLTPFNEVNKKRAFNSFPQISKEMMGQPVDINEIAFQYRASVPAVRPDDLFVFASFSMPTAALENLFRDVSKVDAVVVFRGFKNNSWKETAEALASLKNNGVNAIVNPAAFKSYKVNLVPTVVVTKPEAHQQADNEGCAFPDHYASLQGDVTLEYALSYIARKKPTWKPLTDRYIKTLRGSL